MSHERRREIECKENVESGNLHVTSVAMTTKSTGGT